MTPVLPPAPAPAPAPVQALADDYLDALGRGDEAGALRTELHDFPFALTCLDAGHDGMLERVLRTTGAGVLFTLAGGDAAERESGAAGRSDSASDSPDPEWRA